MNINTLRKEARVNAFVRLARKVGLAKMPKGGLGISGLVDTLPVGSDVPGLSVLINRANSYRKGFKRANQELYDYFDTHKLDDTLYPVRRRLGKHYVPKNLEKFNRPEVARLVNMLSKSQSKHLDGALHQLRSLHDDRENLIDLIRTIKSPLAKSDIIHFHRPVNDLHSRYY
jgi:hypothetical protein